MSLKDFKLVLCTGAPGSAWSMISNRLKGTFAGFDRSDENEERRYYMPEDHKQGYHVHSSDWKGTTHVGCYFGPNHEFGHGFNDIPKNYSKEEFFKECLKPYSNDKAPYKLIRSHWFAYNLDWLWENCKGQKLFLIWRDPKAAEEWWYSMGGWDIYYPVYSWYEGPARMKKMIEKESNLLIDFAEKKKIDWTDYSDTWIKDRWPNAVEKDYKASPVFKDQIKIAYVDIK